MRSNTRLTVPAASASPLPMGRLLHDVARLRRKLLDSEMQPAGLTRSQWSVLSALAAEPAPIMQSELARRLEIGKVTLGGLIDRLEAKGFVRREADKDDRRVKRLALTPRARKTVAAMDDVRPVIDDIVMRGLSLSHRAALAEGLAVMRANLLQLQRGQSAQKLRQRLSRVADVG